MKKFTALGMSLIVGASAIASTGLLTRKAVLSQTEQKTEIQKKSVKLPFKMKGVAKHLPKGVARINGKARLAINSASRKNVSARISGSNANIYGWLGYYSDDDSDTSERGLNKVNMDGTWTTIFNSECISLGIGVKDGVAYAQIYEDGYYGIDYVADVTIDIATGEVLSETEIDMESEPEKFFYGLAYDMESMKAYGYRVVGGETIEFACKDIDTGIITGIAESENLYKMLTFNQATGEVVCIDLDSSTLVGIDPATGEQTVKGTIDIVSDYVGGLCYSPADKAYIWNPNAQDWSYLVKVSETGKTEMICDVELAGQYQAMFCTDLEAVDPGAPARAVIERIDFPDGSTSGSISWRMPSVTEGGTALSGAVYYSVSLDGEEYTSGSASAGSVLKIDFKNLTQANHTFKIILSADGKQGRSVSTSQYIGNDTPKAPAAVTLSEETVSWEPVTEGLHKGYIDLSKLRYNVRINGVSVAENVDGTSCAAGLEPGTPLDNYVAEVEAVCNGLVSSATSSNAIVFGEPLSMPVNLEPTEQQANLFVVADNNGDEYSWEFVDDSDMGLCFRYQYGYEKADDWLFLPPVKVSDTNRMLYFSMQYAVKAENMPEEFEVRIGTSADAASMTTPLIEKQKVSNTEYSTAETYFTLPEAGVYYIGIHAMSEPDMFYLFAKNFILEQSDITAAGPEGVTDIIAEAGTEGALEATVSFVLPAKTIGGAEINPADKVKATVWSEAGTASVEAAPGSRQSVKVPTVQGMNRISIQAETNGNLGSVVKVNVYTGLDIPGIPTNIHAEVSEDNCVAKITWNAPTTGENGGYVKPTGITYYLCQYTIFGWAVLGELGTDVYEYTVDVPAGSPQDRYDIGVLCENEAGQASYLATVHPVLGLPYQLPAIENFSDGNFTYGPVSVGGDADADYNISDPSELGEQYECDHEYAMIGECYSGGKGEIVLPKFSTKELENATLELGVYFTGAIKVYAQAYGTERTEVLNTSDMNHSGYCTLPVTLPLNMQNKGWVTFSIENDYSMSDVFILTGYRVRNLVAHDLSVKVSGTTSAAIGEKLNYVATITNEGTETSDFAGGKWIVSRNGEIIAESYVTTEEVVPLAPGECMETEFETVADAGYVGDINVEYSLFAEDDYNNNNSGSLKVSVKRGEAIVVTDLKAAVDNDAVCLSWSAPLGKAVSESFEDETPFVLSPDKLGAFENIDRDGGEVYTWEDGDKIWDGAGKPGAFSVFSASQLDEITGQTGAFTAADGDKFLLAFCPIPGSEGASSDNADDWLISPECEGGSEFAFSLRCITSQYGCETLEVLVAKDSSRPEDFTLLENLEVENDEYWERFSFRLPEDANYFAIRYTSDDIFGIMIDAIDFQPAGTVVDVKNYEIYRQTGSSDFEKIAGTEGYSYTDRTAELSAELRYYVVPVLNNGERGEKSNIVLVKTTGMDMNGNYRYIIARQGEIMLIGFEGMEYAVTAAGGTTVARGTASENESVSVAPGIYMVNADGKTVKLMVK